VAYNHIANSTGEAIAVYGRWDCVIRNNTMWNNNRAGGMTTIYVSASQDINITGNLIGRGNFSGIYIQSTDGANVRDNTVINNTENGIWISSCTNTTISWNLIRGNRYNGIWIASGTTNTTIHNNTILFNNIDKIEYDGGIKVYYSSWFDIDNNTISNNPYYGIWLDYAHNGTIRGNEVTFNCGGRAGLGMRYVEFTHIFYNNISNSTGHGIDAFDIHSCVIHNNTINGNNMDELKDGGIYLYNCRKNTFNDNEVLNNTGYGFHFMLSENNTLARNTVSGHDREGMFFEFESTTNILVDNTVTWNNINEDGFRAGIHLDESGWCTLTGNTVSNNKIYGVFLDYSNNVTIEWNDIVRNCGGKAGVILDHSHWNEIYWNNISNSTGTAIDMFYSDNNTFHNNTLNGNDMGMTGNAGGIYLSYCDRNLFVDNIMLDNRIRAISMQYSENNTFIRCDIGRNGGRGFSGGNCNNLTVTNCSIWSNSGAGIYMMNTWHLQITWNELFNNSNHGIYLYDSNKGIIYLNNLYGNGGTSSQGYDNNNNTWDNGTHGNYWDDYNGTDSGGDGIGDTPYALDGGAEDSYPLTNRTDNNVPREVPEFGVLAVVGFMVVVFAAVFRRRRLI